MTVKSQSELIQHLRDHIIGAMHVGQLRAGDRLPSIREMAQQVKRNSRTVKSAYATLEGEGLVEIRDRSGVFIAAQDLLGGETSEEMTRWLSGVLAEGWKRRIPITVLPQLIKRFTASRRVRCGLVELIEDGVAALRYDLEVDWGFDVRVLAPDDLKSAEDIDFFAATSFYAPLIHHPAEALGKPLVVLTIHPALQDAIRSRLREGWLTVVAVDARFGHRIQVAYAPDHPELVRLVLADDAAAIDRLDPSEPVLLTRAASEKLGTHHLRILYPHSPTLSPETAHMLANIVIRENVAAVNH